MRADLLNQPVRLERVAGGFTKRTRSSRFPAVRGTVRLQNEGAMGRKSRQPRFVFTKRTPDRVAGGRRFYKTNPLVPVSGGARSRSGYKTKPRWGEVALTPIRFHKTNPRPCGGRKAVLQFEPARPGFRRCAVAVPVTKRSRDGPEVAPPPIRFHKTNPRPCGGRKAVLQFEPARPVSGGARSQSGYKLLSDTKSALYKANLRRQAQSGDAVLAETPFKDL